MALTLNMTDSRWTIYPSGDGVVSSILRGRSNLSTATFDVGVEYTAAQLATKTHAQFREDALAQLRLAFPGLDVQ